jgi:hypothetical protein
VCAPRLCGRKSAKFVRHTDASYTNVACAAEYADKLQLLPIITIYHLAILGCIDDNICNGRGVEVLGLIDFRFDGGVALVA